MHEHCIYFISNPTLSLQLLLCPQTPSQLMASSPLTIIVTSTHVHIQPAEPM